MKGLAGRFLALDEPRGVVGAVPFGRAWSPGGRCEWR